MKTSDDLQFQNKIKKKTDVSILDISFISSQDVIILLRSDFCIELLLLQGRSNISIESVEYIGIHIIPQIYTKISVFDSINNDNDNEIKLFATGTTKNIDVWNIKTEKQSLFRFEKTDFLSKHSDVCRDVLVINNKQFSLLVSCGLDGNVLVWDVVTLNLKGKRFVL